MYVIRELKTNQYFCYKHNTIISFKDIQEVNSFIQSFFQYSIQRAMAENPQLIFEVLEMHNNINIEGKPESITTIDFDTIKKERTN